MKKLFWLLLISCVISFIAVIPYSLTLQGEFLEIIPIPLEILLIAQVAQNTLLFAVFIYVGLRLSAKVDLEIPFLTAWLSQDASPEGRKSTILLAFSLGLLGGVLIVMADLFFLLLNSEVELLKAYPGQPVPPLWQAALGTSYGAIAEEVAIRLFVMSLLVWLFYRFQSSDDSSPSVAVIWSSIVFSAVLFGLSHLPSLFFITTLTPFLILRVTLLNSIGGIVFGWLYWRKGLEAAMIAHFAMDIVLHIVVPLFI